MNAVPGLAGRASAVECCRKTLPAELEYFLNTAHWLDASAGIEHALPKLVDAMQLQLMLE
jgi:hypothetical protein